MHVHVEVDDPAEGVHVLDGIAPWLPVLLAISANSPYFRGRDTGHASWRDQLWRRLPSRGTGEPFGSTATYRDVSDRLVAWGAGLDEQMIYFDARLSPSFPTVELRVADVCLDVENGVLVAGLARALVTTYADRSALPGWRSDLQRAATWRASRDGIGGSLVDPRTLELAAPRDVIAGLIDECREALEATDDLELVESSIETLFARGNGAMQQRRSFEATGELTAVVDALRERTEASWT
jgi:carboxylate-amine ligase